MDGFAHIIHAGIVDREHWPMLDEDGILFATLVYHLSELQKIFPWMFVSDKSEEESREWTERIRQAEDEMELEEVDRVEQDKTFMHAKEIPFGIPKEILNKITSRD